MIVAIAALDLITGYEVAAFPFYSIPILVVVWFSSARTAVFISVLCGVAWFCTDTASGHHYSHEWLRFWDAGIRMMFFFLVLFAGATLRNQRDAQNSRIQLLERAQKLEREILNISEREQERIGRDLHDGLCQFLAAINFAAGRLRQKLSSESHSCVPAVNEIVGLLRDSIVYARDIARGFSPVDRSEAGLETALNELAITTSRLYAVDCVFASHGVSQMTSACSLHLYRIAQESLSNALKHGEARKVEIVLEGDSEGILLRVSDDGKGFDPGATQGSGMGLNIMQYRARTIGASFAILPNPPHGTIILCRVANA